VKDDKNRVSSKEAGGLDGTLVADTELSHVDGEKGRLVLRGHRVEALGPRASLEAVAALLWDGAQPDDQGAEREMRRAFAAARVRAFEELPRLGSALSLPDAMDALRAAVAQVTLGEGTTQQRDDGNGTRAPLRAATPSEGATPSDDATPSEGATLAGAVAVFAAAWSRRAAGLEPLAPDPALSHAADYLRLVRGVAPSPALERALSTYLVTVADHGMNASTFAARVVASTGSDAVSAIVAGIGALKGPLHGGAPGPVLDMLDAIGSPERAAAWLRAELEAGRRIMGLGHRIYRVRDPRAAVLEGALEHLQRSGTASKRLALARAVERAAVELLAGRYPERALQANVEFYTAVLLDAIGLDRRLFSATFAVGRVVGWYAHVREQRRTGRLIRPASRYVGPPASSEGARRRVKARGAV
jgi:citrate synthase